MNRVLIVGLDGATFDLIRPWADEGRLPNLARLLREGAHAPLRSTVPPMTFPAWTSFMTGKNPGKHGIFDFTERRPSTYQVQFVNARQRRARTMWSLLSDGGKRVCAIGVPATWPAEPVNGAMISGFDAPRMDDTAMYPPGLFQEITEKVGAYRITSNIVKEIDGNRPDLAIESILETARQKSRTAKYLYGREPWDCFMIMFGETDVVSHHFWKYMDPSSPHHEPAAPAVRDGILRVYQELDRTIGELCAMAPPGTSVLVASDHGFGGAGKNVLHMNRRLAETGYLAFRTKGPAARLVSIGMKILGRTKVWGMRLLPTPVRRRLRYRKSHGLANRMESMLRFGGIDWASTRAYSEETPYYPAVWINLRGRDPQGTVSPGAEYEKLRDELIASLESWRNPRTGRRVVRKVWKREDVYTGEQVEKAADLVLEYELDGSCSYLSRPSFQARRGGSIEELDPRERGVSRFMSNRSGSHRDHGVFVLHGPAARAGERFEGAEIVDIAPTVMHLLGCPVPADMDGKVLVAGLADSFLRQNPVRRAADAAAAAAHADPGYTEEEEAQISERLKQWGYL